MSGDATSDGIADRVIPQDVDNPADNATCPLYIGPLRHPPLGCLWATLWIAGECACITRKRPQARPVESMARLRVPPFSEVFEPAPPGATCAGYNTSVRGLRYQSNGERMTKRDKRSKRWTLFGC